MSVTEAQSLSFYNYLCHKIGTKKIVQARRLLFTILDIGYKDGIIVHSGSTAEGLDLKGSDFDLMTLKSYATVYETEIDALRHVRNADTENNTIFIMDTEDCKPCFTRLRLFSYKLMTNDIQCSVERYGQDYLFSSELLKLYNLSSDPFQRHLKINGPCITTNSDTVDTAFCIKCNNWISSAQPWISRSRKSWPSPNLISKITSFGVLFVPKGCRNSPNEGLEWRISFSVAEKLMICSFSHTQLLCYALLKILLKEVINRIEGLNGLLCSYFLKNLIFWIFEETEPSIWQPHRLISCFSACVKRLLYCVQYSTLLHYFIPENNMFEDRFSSGNTAMMENLLRDLYDRGLKCFLMSTTLSDYNESLYISNSCLSFGNTYLIHGLMKQLVMFSENGGNMHTLLHCLIHQGRIRLEKDFLTFYYSKTNQGYAQVCTTENKSNNKRNYIEYKVCQHHLLIGLHTDAVSGWLLLASFFYVKKRYNISLSIIKYALSKCTEDKIFSMDVLASENYPIDQRIFEYLNLFTYLNTSTIDQVVLQQNSSLSPVELQIEVLHHHYDIPPVVFGYFLRFLCFYHLGDNSAALESLDSLELTIEKKYRIGRADDKIAALTCLGIAYQMMGRKDLARLCFQYCDEINAIYITSVPLRLSSVY